MTITTQRAQWPHTINDITSSLDGIWGLVGAMSTHGNLLRLERSLHEPLSYTITEYRGNDETDVVRRETYDAKERDRAINLFAQAIGFEVG